MLTHISEDNEYDLPGIDKGDAGSVHGRRDCKIWSGGAPSSTPLVSIQKDLVVQNETQSREMHIRAKSRQVLMCIPD